MEQLKQNMRMAEKTAEKSSEQERQSSVELTTVKLSSNAGPKDAELRKMVRRPRKRKSMKALKLLDVLSTEDEQLIERMRAEASSKGKGLDMEMLKEMSVEDILKEINSQYMNFDSLRIIISPCGLPNCWIHSISKSGEVKEHYKDINDARVDEEMRKAGEIVSKSDNWTCVEIYDNFMIHLTEGGDIIKIYE